MVIAMRVNGTVTLDMALATIFLQMVTSTEASTSMANPKGPERTSGRTGLSTMETS